MEDLWEKYLKIAHPIYRAVRDRNLNEVRSHLEGGVPVDLVDENLPSLFVFAWDPEDFSMMDLLVEFGYDLGSSLDAFGETPLIRASDNSKLFHHLLEKGGDFMIADNHGNTCAHRAAARGNLEILRYCLEHGIAVDVADRQKSTPLRSASLGEQTETMRVLVTEYQADIEAPKTDGRTILIQTAQAGKLRSVEVLLELGADAAATDRWRKTAYDWAVANGHESCAKALTRWSEQADAGKPDPAAS